VEIERGLFRRVIELGRDAAAQHARATYQDGILRLDYDSENIGRTNFSGLKDPQLDTMLRIGSGRMGEVASTGDRGGDGAVPERRSSCVLGRIGAGEQPKCRQAPQRQDPQGQSLVAGGLGGGRPGSGTTKVKAVSVPSYSTVAGLAAPAHAAGVSALSDQAQAGAIMWVGGSTIALAVGLWAILAAMVAEERRLTTRENRLRAAGGAG